MPISKPDFECVRCGYHTTRKVDMKYHLYDKKTQCQMLKCNIELTDGIKLHILTHRIYLIPTTIVQNQTIINYNALNPMDKLLKCMNYINKYIFDFEECANNKYKYKKLEPDSYKYPCSLDKIVLLNIMDNVAKTNINALVDNKLNILQMYKSQEWDCFLLETGIVEVIRLMQSHFLNMYEVYLIKNIYHYPQNNLSAVNLKKAHIYLYNYYNFILLFDLPPFIYGKSNNDILNTIVNVFDNNTNNLPINGNKKFKIEDMFMEMYNRHKIKINKCDKNQMIKTVLDIFKLNDIDSTGKIKQTAMIDKVYHYVIPKSNAPESAIIGNDDTINHANILSQLDMCKTFTQNQDHFGLDLLQKQYFDSDHPNYVYPNQINAAKSIMSKWFNHNIKWISLIAQPQVGKTGVITQINNMIYDSAVKNHLDLPDNLKLIVVTGMSSIELKEQTSKRLVSGKGDKYVEILFNKDIQKIIKNRLDDYINSPLLIIIDESHYGRDPDSIVDKFLVKICQPTTTITDFSNWNKKDAYILSISATPFNELTDNSTVETELLHPSESYLSINMLYNMCNIKQAYNLKSGTECQMFFKDNIDLIFQNKYIIIRISDNNDKKKAVQNIEFIRNTLKSDGIEMDILDYTTSKNSKFEKIDDLNQTIKQSPKNPTIILVSARLRAGYTLETTQHISLVHDTCSEKTKTQTVVQSLLGRICGYNKNKAIIAYVQLEYVMTYIEWVNSFFGQPNSGKFDNNQDTILDCLITQSSLITPHELANVSQMVYSRNNQKQLEFRNKLIEKYKVCQITGVTSRRCDAAHILPYNQCNNFDINNGFLLRKDLHAAFDSHELIIDVNTGLVTLNEDIENITGKQINLTKENVKYLKQKYKII